MKISKLLLATVGATVLLGALVSSASARNFSVSNQNISSMWRSVEFALPGATTRCQVTLEGSLHSRTFAKVIGSLIGYITKAILGPCAASTFTILSATLPWHVTYSGFEGALPNIRSLITHIVGYSLRFRESGGIACLVRSSAARPAVGIFHIVSHTVTEAGLSGRIPTGIECFGIEGTFSSDSGRVSLSGTGAAISVSLI